MARIFITGSADGLGQLAAKALVTQGHRVTLHARNSARAEDALRGVPGAEGVLVADLSGISETKALAEEANRAGPFDAVIHNAGVYQGAGGPTADGFPALLAVNTLAPYILTCLMHRPKRLIYMSSGMHSGGDPTLGGLESSPIRASYSDTKLHDLILSMAVARRWAGTVSNAVDPGWVPTKMGGAGAPDSLAKGYETQVWLAAGNDPEALETGRYLHHQRPGRYLQQAADEAVQERLLEICGRLTGVHFTSTNQVID